MLLNGVSHHRHVYRHARHTRVVSINSETDPNYSNYKISE